MFVPKVMLSLFKMYFLHKKIAKCTLIVLRQGKYPGSDRLILRE